MHRTQPWSPSGWHKVGRGVLEQAGHFLLCLEDVEKLTKITLLLCQHPDIQQQTLSCNILREANYDTYCYVNYMDAVWSSKTPLTISVSTYFR